MALEPFAGFLKISWPAVPDEWYYLMAGIVRKSIEVDADGLHEPQLGNILALTYRGKFAVKCKSMEYAPGIVAPHGLPSGLCPRVAGLHLEIDAVTVWRHCFYCFH